MPEPEPYYIDGLRVPSVTQVTGIFDKPEVTRWRERLAADERDPTAGRAEAKRLAGRGNRLHEAALRLLERKPVMPSPEENVRRCVRSLDTWIAEMIDEVIFAEQPVYNHFWRYAGRPDFFGTLFGDTGSLWLVDWKGSHAERPYWEWTLQLAGYADCDAINEVAILRGLPVRRAIVTINPDGDCFPHFHRLTSDEDDKQTFLCALACYNSRQRYKTDEPL
jgi:hypothetical protein